MVTKIRERLMWVTSTGKPVDHALTDDAMAAGMASQGVYLGLCGIQFVAAPMAAAPGPRCATCWQFVQARASLSTVEQRLGGARARRLPLPASCARFLAALFASDSSVVPPPRSATAAAGAEAPAGAAEPGSRRGRADDGQSGARPRRVPSPSAPAGGGGR
jgi:hypothetical protein